MDNSTTDIFNMRGNRLSFKNISQKGTSQRMSESVICFVLILMCGLSLYSCL